MEQLLSTLRFDRMTAACAGVVTVRQGDLYGFFGGDGLYAPCVWEKADYFREGLAAVRRGGKWGFIDRRGEVAVPCVWDEAQAFADGLAAVRRGEKWGFINGRGELALPRVWEDAFSFDGGIARVRRRGKWGLIGVDGTTILPCVCTKRMLLTSRGYGFALQKHRLRVFDRRGELAL